MLFKVNMKFKKRLKKKANKYNKVVRIAKLVEGIVLILAMLSVIGEPLYHIYTNSANEIVFASAFARLMGFLVVWVAAFTMKKRIENFCFTGEKTTEYIEIREHTLYYTYRIKYKSTERQRYFVVVNLDKIDKFFYDEKLRKIVLVAESCKKSVIAGKREDISESDMKMEEWTMYDYFTPRLYEKLKEFASPDENLDELM